MIYLEHIPAPPLNRFVRMLWYAQARECAHRRERILPTGSAQLIISLARDFILDCPEGGADLVLPPSLIVGARSIYEIVDTSDMADLIGIVFQPGGLPIFARDAADRFRNASVALEDLWGIDARGLRNRLLECDTPDMRLATLESYLAARFAPGNDLCLPHHHRAISFALQEFERDASLPRVKRVAQSVGWSERRFSQVFREQVGLTPKVWCRVRRFQRAVRCLRAGGDVRWTELALNCGFYDQSHFANEFRAFSGIDATTYSARLQTPWANHVPDD